MSVRGIIVSRKPVSQSSSLHREVPVTGTSGGFLARVIRGLFPPYPQPRTTQPRSHARSSVHGGNSIAAALRQIGPVSVNDSRSLTAKHPSQRPGQPFRQRSVFSEGVAQIRTHPLYDRTSNSRRPYGSFGGRPIVGECTKIIGGVYIGVYPLEIISINEEHGDLVRLFDKLSSRLGGARGASRLTEQQIVSEAITLARETLYYNPQKTFALVSSHLRRDSDELSLDTFVREGVGVARHQILLSAYLIEKLRLAEWIRGGTYLDAVIIAPNAVHEKLIYTTSEGKLLYFDPERLQKESAPETRRFGVA